MPTVRSSGLLRDVATIPCADEALRRRGRYRRDAIDLLERDDLLGGHAPQLEALAVGRAQRRIARVGARALE